METKVRELRGELRLEEEEGKQWEEPTHPRSKVFAEERAAPCPPDQESHRLPVGCRDQEGPPD